MRRGSTGDDHSPKTVPASYSAHHFATISRQFLASASVHPALKSDFWGFWARPTAGERHRVIWRRKKSAHLPRARHHHHLFYRPDWRNMQGMFQAAPASPFFCFLIAFPLWRYRLYLRLETPAWTSSGPFLPSNQGVKDTRAELNCPDPLARCSSEVSCQTCQ